MTNIKQIVKNEKIFKVRVYAFFQFTSFTSYIFFMMSIALMGYFLMVHGGMITETRAWWEELGDIARGKNSDDVLSLTATVFFYLGLGALINAYLIGFSISLVKKRNLYDSLFLLFVIIPGLSNVFAIMAQTSSKEIILPRTTVDKKAIIDAELRKLDKTRLVAIKQLEESNHLLNKIKAENAKKEKKKSKK